MAGGCVLRADVTCQRAISPWDHSWDELQDTAGL
jgi:hypothetical protein